MKKTIINLLFFIYNLTFCQLSYDANFRETILDVNNDKINDTVTFDNKQNNFTFKYDKGMILKKITFFENYPTSVFTYMHVVKNYLTFEMKYAPKYLNKNIFSFSYSKVKDDWILVSVLLVYLILKNKNAIIFLANIN